MPPQKPCVFYRTNSCKKGASCTFSHTQQFSPGQSIICKHYRVGTCMFGERCKALHLNPGQNTTPDSSKPSCVYWKAGRCDKGDQCSFSHEPLVSDATSWREQQPGRSSAISFGPQLSIRPADRQRDIADKQTFSHLQVSVKQDPLIQESLVNKTPAPSLPQLHPSQVKNQVKDTPPSDTTVERNFLRTQVTFEVGGAIREIQTAFESRRVMLSNIPHETSQKDIIDIAAALGSLKSVILTPPALGITGKAELEYLDVKSAKTAAVALDGQKLRTQRLAAQLNLRSADMDTADLRSSTLKMSWFAPSRLAYAHYDTIFSARQKASSLDGRNFADRKVSTTFQQPSGRQRCSFTVIVKGLPQNIRIDDLKKFCGTDSVSIGQSTYHGKEGTKRVRELLEDFGPLESFDHSHPTLKDIKVKALVRFAKPEHAAAAAAELHGQSYSFLGGAKIWITLLHSIKYNIPARQSSALKEELHRLQDKNDHGAKIRVYDTDETGRAVDPVCVRIYGDDPKALGRLKSGIERLLSGEELIHEGVPLWDDFFFAEGSRSFVEHVEQDSGAFVRRDTRRRKLHVSGSPEQRDLALGHLFEKIQELRGQRHRISLTKPNLGRLLQGEFTRLQSLLGEDKLTLDIRNQELIVQGDEEEIQVARLSLIALEVNIISPATRNGDSHDCPVCFCEITNPVQLSCGHSYCLACLRHYLASAESFPVKCLAEDGHCDLPVPLGTISHVLTPADENKLFETAFLAYIHQHPTEFHYCPTPDCQLIYRPAEPGIVIRCFSCFARICAHCHVENHEGLTCEQHRYNQTGGEEAFRRWKEENNVHACPGCGADIQKRDGCNHITCVRCRTHMCWVCRMTFKGGKGIYDHMRAAHGDIGVEWN